MLYAKMPTGMTMNFYRSLLLTDVKIIYRLQYISMSDCIVLLYWLSSVTPVLCSECYL